MILFNYQQIFQVKINLNIKNKIGLNDSEISSFRFYGKDVND